MSLERLTLTGSELTLSDVAAFVKNARARVEFLDSARAAVERSKTFLDRHLSDGIIYGVNTGFGPMAAHIIAKDSLAELQRNLIWSHAVGIGEPIPDCYVVAMMLVRLNTLAKGFSGVSWALVERLQTLLNKRIVPLVPEHGAVGTSGDLVQLAHIALALLGQGEVRYENEIRPAGEVLRENEMPPYELEPKEGLALINGTSGMSGIAALLCVEARTALSVATRTGALGFELMRGFHDGISDRFHSLRPHQGQVQIAATLRNYLQSSKLLRDRAITYTPYHSAEEAYILPEPVQEIYSLRCIPQILGPVLDTLAKTWSIVEIEINAVTDNPVVDAQENLFLHGGHFHGEYIASAVDQLKAALVKLTMLSERRINCFLNPNMNRRFPPFLNLNTLGLNLGLQGLQFVATSTAAQSQTLAFPHSVHSIPTNGDNQDVVSMGLDAALLAMKVLQNAYVVLAIEAVTLAQAVDYLGDREQLSLPSQEFFKLIRRALPKIDTDRPIHRELAMVVEAIKATQPMDFCGTLPAARDWTDENDPLPS
ncbi:MAG TPA: aromatic amino acid ammonia-lyase [Bryobacteraceae bacterium]